MSVCPSQCILIDSHLFKLSIRRYIRQYSIDLLKCIHCNLCGLVCPVNCIVESSILYLSWVVYTEYLTDISILMFNGVCLI